MHQMDLSRTLKEGFIIGVGALVFVTISYSIFSLTSWHINIVMLISLLIFFTLSYIIAYLYYRYREKIGNFERFIDKI